MVNIHTLKKANFFSETIYLDCVESTQEITSTAFPVKILDIRWKSSSPVDIYYQDVHTSSSHMTLPPGENHTQFNLASNGMEIPGTARFFISSSKGKEGEYVQITYVG